ncbi:hypothetical protein, partial [Brooklawnia sp.]|uniref:hypothetical protein n=1 Tax=Brooklawnia sp. TaxID=2699740 RepID=UPI00311E88D4
LSEPGDVLPFKDEAQANRPLLVVSDKFGDVGRTGGSGRGSWSEMASRRRVAREERTGNLLA